MTMVAFCPLLNYEYNVVQDDLMGSNYQTGSAACRFATPAVVLIF